MDNNNNTYRKRCLTLERNEKRAELLDVLQAEAAEWIQNLLSCKPIPPEDLLDKLKTGVVLCDVLSKLKNKKTKSRRVSNLFFARENIQKFLRGAKRYGVRDDCLFEPDDLVKRRNDWKVINCLIELSKVASTNGVAAPLIVQYEMEIAEDIRKEKKQKRMQAQINAAKLEMDRRSVEQPPELPLPSLGLDMIKQKYDFALDTPKDNPKIEKKKRLSNAVQNAAMASAKRRNSPRHSALSAHLHGSPRHSARSVHSVGSPRYLGSPRLAIARSISRTKGESFPTAAAAAEHSRSQNQTTRGAVKQSDRDSIRRQAAKARQAAKINMGRMASYDHIRSKVDCRRPSTSTTPVVSAAPAEIPHFVPARGDKLDKKIYNLMKENDLLGVIPFQRIHPPGKGKYQVDTKIVYIREVRHMLLVRVGGGWVELKSFITKQAMNRSRTTLVETRKFP